RDFWPWPSAVSGAVLLITLPVGGRAVVVALPRLGVDLMTPDGGRPGCGAALPALASARGASVPSGGVGVSYGPVGGVARASVSASSIGSSCGLRPLRDVGPSSSMAGTPGDDCTSVAASSA